MRGLILLAVCLVGSGLLSACAQQRAADSETGLDSDGRRPPSIMRTAPADSSQDCLASIPKDATPGQRAIAERTCERDEAERRTTTRGEAASPGTAGDTLQACMQRIPAGSSAGQRMIAEESCRRDEAGRGAPGR